MSQIGRASQFGQLNSLLSAEFARFDSDGFLVVIICGACVMFGCLEKTVELRWEWPAGRVPGRVVVVQVDTLKADGGVLFGLRNLPSIADGFPDSMILEGFVQKGAKDWGRVRLRYSRRDVPEVAVGDKLGLAMADEYVGVSRLAADSPRNLLGKS